MFMSEGWSSVSRVFFFGSGLSKVRRGIAPRVRFTSENLTSSTQEYWELE